MDNNYKNDFGELNGDRITLLINDKEHTFNLKNLVRVQYVKRQKFHINYLVFLICSYLFYYFLTYTFTFVIQIIVSLIIILLLTTAFFLKSFQYQFVIIKNNQIVKIIINKNLSKDAERLANKINKKLQIII